MIFFYQYFEKSARVQFDKQSNFTNLNTSSYILFSIQNVTYEDNGEIICKLHYENENTFSTYNQTYNITINRMFIQNYFKYIKSLID